ncbi:hypothetical protein M404DRAFT_947529 [Pisolithus tinctorius Marx 270]|uniref:Uncharacterized protein n=1 Tax=Pisolithus tinctorius Marx 270 TaxID=870435 RepID=A0A0C3PCN5_PISTI|nr:hypothetical protein M404DRAFT_947529 [Pisolithus tinctorius Marx 270]
MVGSVGKTNNIRFQPSILSKDRGRFCHTFSVGAVGLIRHDFANYPLARIARRTEWLAVHALGHVERRLSPCWNSPCFLTSKM